MKITIKVRKKNIIFHCDLAEKVWLLEQRARDEGKWLWPHLYLHWIYRLAGKCTWSRSPCPQHNHQHPGLPFHSFDNGNRKESRDYGILCRFHRWTFSGIAVWIFLSFYLDQRLNVSKADNVCVAISIVPFGDINKSRVLRH